MPSTGLSGSTLNTTQMTRTGHTVLIIRVVVTMEYATLEICSTVF